MEKWYKRSPVRLRPEPVGSVRSDELDKRI